MKKNSDNELAGNAKGFSENDKDRALKQLMKTLEAVNGRLKESESLKTNFLSNIRNEINNPLTIIMGLSHQIKEGTVTDFSAVKVNAGIIYSEAFDLDFQLRNIFIAAELEAGEFSLTASNVDMKAFIQNTIQSFKHKADQKGIEIVFSYEASDAGDKEFFRTDPEKFKIILSNLLSNAIEFSPDKGRVELETKRYSRNLVFTMKDYGTGFNMDNEKIIFERFRQLDTGMRRKHRGHGLGLSIVKDLVELFGGTISVASAEGKGAFFAVSIPELETTAETDVFSDDGNVFIF